MAARENWRGRARPDSAIGIWLMAAKVRAGLLDKSGLSHGAVCWPQDPASLKAGMQGAKLEHWFDHTAFKPTQITWTLVSAT